MSIGIEELVLALVGAILGVAATKAYEYINYFIRSRKSHYLAGRWYGYYLTIKNEEEFMGEEEIYLEQGRLKQFSVKGSSLSFEQKYTGEGYEESNFLVLHYLPTKHYENIFVRFEKSISGNDGHLLGLWSAWDFDGKAAVGAMVLSREELNEEQVREECKRIKVHPKIKYMRVP